jgi:hypothetical protein
MCSNVSEPTPPPGASREGDIGGDGRWPCCSRGRFDPLLRQLFDNQPEEGTGGFTADVLITLGAAAGIGHEGYRSGVRGGVWEDWVIEREARFAIQSPNGTPTLVLHGETIASPFLYDPDALGKMLRT